MEAKSQGSASSTFPHGFSSPFRAASYTSSADTTGGQTLIHNKPHANHVILFTYCPFHCIAWSFLSRRLLLLYSLYRTIIS